MGKWLEKVKQLENKAIDANHFIDRACHGLPVSVDWVKREVLDEFDIQTITNGDLSQTCLIAHIKYHIKRQKIVEMRNIGTNKTYKTSASL